MFTPGRPRSRANIAGDSSENYLDGYLLYDKATYAIHPSPFAERDTALLPRDSLLDGSAGKDYLCLIAP